MWIFNVYLVGCVCFLSGVNSISWGYDPDNGPSTWGGTCKSGQHQSPINIAHNLTEEDSELRELTFTNYGNDGPLEVKNYENTVKISGFPTWANAPYMTGGPLKDNYILQQIHFHWSQSDNNGSEHTVDRRHFSVEVHLVHQKNGTKDPLPSNGYAVIAVFVNIGDDGNAFDAIDDALKNLAEPNTSTPINKFKANQLLRNNYNDFYTYNGSLTTPSYNRTSASLGCNETVVWLVLLDPISITRDQINLLRQLKSERGKPYEYNFRPTQPLNERPVKRRSSSTNNGSSIASIILIVLAALVLGAALLVWYIRRQRARRQQAPGPIGEYSQLLSSEEH